MSKHTRPLVVGAPKRKKAALVAATLEVPLVAATPRIEAQISWNNRHDAKREASYPSVSVGRIKRGTT